MGSLVMETAPITMTNSAITHAKMGRSMKNLDIVPQPFFACEAAGAAEPAAEAAEAAAAAADAGSAGARAPGAGARPGVAGPPAVHGTGFTGAPGRTFWKPSTITCSPGCRPDSTTHWPFWEPPILIVRGLTWPLASTTMTVSPCGERVTACWGSSMALPA